MRILLVTNMRPSPQKPYSGIFVINQYNKLKEDTSLNVALFSMERTFTNAFGSYLKYFKAIVAFIPCFFKKFDVLHIHYFFPFIALAHFYKVIRPSTRLVVTFHGSDINVRVNQSNLSVFRFFTKKIDYVISVGADLAHMVHEKLGLETNQILSAGIDETVFHEMPKVEKKYHFTFASSFVPRKGIDVFLKAIELLNKKNIKYCFIGSGELETDVRSLAEVNDITIKLNLKQIEMAEVFNQSYYHILPSRFEPFGLVVTESMFCGTPSIVSNVGGIKDQVKNNINGFIISENTPYVLADQMERCLDYIYNGEYDLLREQCLCSNKEHSIANVIAETKAIYTNLVSKAQ
ncbi:MAG: glycosyltransferase family 4 protein [Cyclobacteriaceae bacterium]